MSVSPAGRQESPSKESRHPVFRLPGLSRICFPASGLLKLGVMALRGSFAGDGPRRAGPLGVGSPRTGAGPSGRRGRGAVGPGARCQRGLQAKATPPHVAAGGDAPRGRQEAAGRVQLLLVLLFFIIHFWSTATETALWFYRTRDQTRISSRAGENNPCQPAAQQGWPPVPNNLHANRPITSVPA